MMIIMISELICDAERPLHRMEVVAEVIKKWITWPEEFRHGVRLCAKHNYVYVNITSIVSSISITVAHL